MMDTAYSQVAKLDFPESVSAALAHIHNQCQKFSKAGVPSSQELTHLMDFIDDFLFGHPRLMKQKKQKRLTAVQQLQLIHQLTNYFSQHDDLSLHCSVFMIIFMVKGRDLEFKVLTLSKLLSISLGTAHLTLLNCMGMWLAQQSPTSHHSLTLARSLVSDYITLMPDSDSSSLSYLPHKSPLLTANLLVAFGELFRASPNSHGFTPPPIQVARLVSSWLQDNPDLCGGQAQTPQQGVIPMTGTTPVSSLVVWAVLEPLTHSLTHSSEHSEVYSQLHLTLVESLQEAASNHPLPASNLPLPAACLSNLTETLLHIFDKRSYPEEKVQQCLDRFGHVLQAFLASKAAYNKDLITLVNQLPHNRLVQIILSNLSR